MCSPNSRRRVLVFIPNYLPGFKSGGILRTLVNTVDWLADDHEFWIVTRDRDLGETQPYDDIDRDRWQLVDGAMVRYLAPEAINTRAIARLVAETPHDVLHLNSFFDPVFTMKVLMARWRGWLPRVPLLLSPRGEFVEGPLHLKYRKKQVYIALTRLVGFYRGVVWHASSIHEQRDFINVLKVNPGNVKIALDLPSRVNLAVAPSELLAKEQLRIVFLSRLTREKNLDHALRILRKVSAPVTFDIYGPAEDADYWVECQQLMTQLPPNITARYHGSVVPTEVAGIFSHYDLFFFPSRGENYGHVIAEAISAGTKVLISKNTPWLDLASEQIGWDVELNDEAEFVGKIEALARLPHAQRLSDRATVMMNAATRLLDPKVVADNRALYDIDQ